MPMFMIKPFTPISAFRPIALRESNIELLDDLERGSVDFYSTMRSAYLQNRKTMGCNAAENTQSYDFDFGIEDEDDTFDEMEAQ